MLRSHTLAPLLGLAALATALAFPTSARAQTYSVTVTDLTPLDPYHFNNAIGYGVSGSTQVGYVLFYPADGDYRKQHQDAVLWTGSVASLIDLNPAGYVYSQATGISGTTQVGYGGVNDSVNNYPDHALLWHGTADSAVDLTPAGFHYARANGVSGNVQVGVGGSTASDNDALLWTGTAASAVNLTPTNLSGFMSSEALGVSGNTQVGDGSGTATNGYAHALLWHGTADSAVDLNPAGYAQSFALGVSGSQQVGYAYPSHSDHAYAMLWTGTAASAIVLDTPNLAGFDESIAFAASGNVQVGLAGPFQNDSHAVLWRGTGASAIDLSSYLPVEYRGAGRALGVETHGDTVDVVGYGLTNPDSDDSILHAFLWHIVFADKSTVTHLYPASRTAGEKVFALTVSGTGFIPQSVITFNGVKMPTHFASSFVLTTAVQATSITQPGTAQIAVVTPGAGTSNSHVLTIMPRPTISALFPSSKVAGSAAFTLTVTGTGYRPASFYAPTVVKWNGLEITTTYVSSTKLTAQVPAMLIAHSSMAQVTVTTPQVATSSGRTFTITP